MTKLLYEDFTKLVNKTAFYVAGIYKNIGFDGSASDLHHAFKHRLADELKNRGHYAKAEKRFYRPEDKDLINSAVKYHQADILVKDSKSGHIVLVEIKVGNDNSLSDEKHIKQHEGQVLNTLEYSGLKLCLIYRLSADGKFNLDIERKILG